MATKATLAKLVQDSQALVGQKTLAVSTLTKRTKERLTQDIESILGDGGRTVADLFEVATEAGQEFLTEQFPALLNVVQDAAEQVADTAEAVVEAVNDIDEAFEELPEEAQSFLRKVGTAVTSNVGILAGLLLLGAVILIMLL